MMETTRLKKRWNAMLLGTLVFGAIALAAVVGAGGAQQNSTAQSTANASGANAVATVVPTARDDAPLLDAWDRAEALHWHGTATPTEEMPPLDTVEGATALKQTSTPTPTEDLEDLSDRHTPEELNAIMAGTSK
jgi:hypothetical protein